MMRGFEEDFEAGIGGCGGLLFKVEMIRRIRRFEWRIEENVFDLKIWWGEKGSLKSFEEG
jgi:hypothetical protein